MLSMNSQGNSFNIPCYFTSKPYSSTINSSVQCSCSFSVLHVYNLIVVWNVNSAMKIVAIEFKTILHGLQGKGTQWISTSWTQLGTSLKEAAQGKKPNDDNKHIHNSVGKQYHPVETGEKPYTINCAKVIFLDQRSQSRTCKDPANSCFTCDRILQEPFHFCSLSCNVFHPISHS
ncbi:hypothetical protein HKD37_06G016531 [Glycine soja]